MKNILARSLAVKTAWIGTGFEMWGVLFFSTWVLWLTYRCADFAYSWWNALPQGAI